jgi:DNA-binding transcriptional LysR family regulator
MDTAEIEVFLVLAEELHFGRTAERLRLPQPRVSRPASGPDCAVKVASART